MNKVPRFFKSENLRKNLIQKLVYCSQTGPIFYSQTFYAYIIPYALITFAVLTYPSTFLI